MLRIKRPCVFIEAWLVAAVIHGTKFDWIAVDHHNTGHPHTQILVRGVMDDGRILNIAGDYIAHGIRQRASEIVTLELGRQTEQKVSRQWSARWTPNASPASTGC